MVNSGLTNILEACDYDIESISKVTIYFVFLFRVCNLVEIPVV